MRPPPGRLMAPRHAVVAASRWRRWKILCIRIRSASICISIRIHRRRIGAAHRGIRIQIRGFSRNLSFFFYGRKQYQSTQTRSDPFSTSTICATEAIHASNFLSHAACRHDRLLHQLASLKSGRLPLAFRMCFTTPSISSTSVISPLSIQKLSTWNHAVSTGNSTIIDCIVHQPYLRVCLHGIWLDH